MKPGEKFKLARKERRLTRHEIERELNLPYSRINQAENSLSSKVLLSMIRHYAPLWQIPEEWFFDGKATPLPGAASADRVVTVDRLGDRPSRYSPGDIVMLPVWKSVFAAEDGDCWYYNHEVEQEAIPALFLDADPSQYFVAKVVGASLEPLASTGDLLLVKRSLQPPLHTLVMAQSPEGHAVCKILRPGVVQPWELHSHNKDCPNIANLEGWTFVGAVHAIFLKSVVPPSANIIWDMAHRPIRIPQ